MFGGVLVGIRVQAGLTLVAIQYMNRCLEPVVEQLLVSRLVQAVPHTLVSEDLFRYRGAPCKVHWPDSCTELSIRCWSLDVFKSRVL